MMDVIMKMVKLNLNIII